MGKCFPQSQIGWVVTPENSEVTEQQTEHFTSTGVIVHLFFGKDNSYMASKIFGLRVGWSSTVNIPRAKGVMCLESASPQSNWEASGLGWGARGGGEAGKPVALSSRALQLPMMKGAPACGWPTAPES